MATVKTNILVTGAAEAQAALRRTVRALAKGPRRSVNRQRRRVRERHRVEAQGRALHLWARCTFGDDVAMGMDVGRSLSDSVGVLVQERGGRRGMSSAVGSWWSETVKQWQRTAFVPRDFTMEIIEARPMVGLPGPEWTAAAEAELRRAIVGDGAVGEPATGSRAVVALRSEGSG